MDLVKEYGPNGRMDQVMREYTRMEHTMKLWTNLQKYEPDDGPNDDRMNQTMIVWSRR